MMLLRDITVCDRQLMTSVTSMMTDDECPVVQEWVMLLM